MSFVTTTILSARTNKLSLQMSVIPGQSVKKIGATYDWCAKKVLFQASGGLTKIKISPIMCKYPFV